MSNEIAESPIELTEAELQDAWQQQRGPIVLPNGRICIGRVAAPPRFEATSRQYAFWVPELVLVEETQIVECESNIAGQTIVYFGVIQEVRRLSRTKDIGQDVDEADGDLSFEPPFRQGGVTYAIVSILRTEPAVLTPPRERSLVLMGTAASAAMTFGADGIDNALSIGLIKNGDSQIAGPGLIDLDFLLGVNGGHLNVNGSAGRGTKSSLLLTLNWMLLDKARREASERPSAPNRLRIVPIILNVKGFDLFYIDRWNRRYAPAKNLPDWRALGVDDPKPFSKVQFYVAAQTAEAGLPIATGRIVGVLPFSWSLGDIITDGLLDYLFAETDAQDVNFGALVLDLETWLTEERIDSNGNITRALRSPMTFRELVNWLDNQIRLKEDSRELRNHHLGTWRKLYRRLRKLVVESRGLLRQNDQQGRPLRVVRADTSDPIVVDLSALAGEPDLQRFVVATILKQLIEARTGTQAVRGLRYIVTLDEINRLAPRGASDSITRLIDTVAAEMRSQGIILLGAQQQASKVSEKVIENSAYRVLGQTGALELSTTTWRALSESARTKAVSLRPDEKLIVSERFREPMLIRVPFPVWAMNPNELDSDQRAPDTVSDDMSDLIEE